MRTMLASVRNDLDKSRVHELAEPQEPAKVKGRIAVDGSGEVVVHQAPAQVVVGSP